MWLAAANLGFLGGSFCLYLGVRRRGAQARAGGRNLELYACGLISLLTLSGLLLAQIGMNASWTGHATVTDLRLLPLASVFVAAILLAHLLLRLQRSRADQLFL